MTREVYDRLMGKLVQEREEITRDLGKISLTISNLEEKVRSAVELCLKFTELWEKGKIYLREKLQKLVFPSGLAYDKKTQSFRTYEVNYVIAQIALAAESLGEEKKGLPPFLWEKSLFAEREGLLAPSRSSLLINVLYFSKNVWGNGGRTCYPQFLKSKIVHRF